MDTAQPLAAAETDPNDQLAAAADAFRAFDNPVVAQPRDDTGKWSREQADEGAGVELEAADETAAEGEDEGLGDDEEADEAAAPAQPMPPSWPADQAEQWSQLPVETQAFLAERETERERAVNAKFQESANARKAAEAAHVEAQNRRNELIQAFETVEALYAAPEPDPRAFGYGTQQFNEAAYYAARQQWQETASVVAQFKEQRDTLQQQASEADAKAFADWKQEHEAQFAPRLLADVPELKDPAKADPLLRELIGYAVANGIPENVFDESAQDQITAGQLHLLWKAQQFDKLRTNKTAPQPKPKPGPAVQPGVSSPRSAQRASRMKRANDRLTREGSLEAAAALFKQMT